MEDPILRELQALKVKLRQLERGWRRREKLSRILESVEFHLAMLEEEIRTLQGTILEEKREVYILLKQKKQEVDHYLDEVDGITKSDAEQAKSAFITKLLEYKPHLIQAYNALKESLEQAEAKEHLTRDLLYGFGVLHAHMLRLLEIRASVKGLGFWRYFTGSRPTALITHEIHEIQKAAEQMRQIQHSDEEIALLLQQLISLCKKHWNFTLIDKHFAPLHGSIIRLHGIYTDLHEVAKIEKDRILLNLSNWIDQA